MFNSDYMGSVQEWAHSTATLGEPEAASARRILAQGVGNDHWQATGLALVLNAVEQLVTPGTMASFAWAPDSDDLADRDAFKVSVRSQPVQWDQYMEAYTVLNADGDRQTLGHFDVLAMRFWNTADRIDGQPVDPATIEAAVLEDATARLDSAWREAERQAARMAEYLKKEANR